MKFIRSIFVLAIAISSILSSTSAYASPKYITILHFNDIHGHLEQETVGGEKIGGAARIAGLVRKIEEANNARGWETLVLFGGDAITGTLLSSQFKGAAEFDFFNALGVDAMVIGNHEFDNRLSGLQKLIDRAKFPLISANIYWKNSGEHLVSPSTIIDKNGLKIAVVGLTTETTYTSTYPANVRGIRFTDTIKEAKKELKSLKGKAPLKIALTHLGVREDIKLAKRIRELSAIIGGHDHVSKDEYCRVIRGTPVCQTPAYGHYLGRLDFEVDGESVKYLGSKLMAITDDIAKDREVKRILQGYSSHLNKRFNEVIGKSTTTITPSRKGRNFLGTLVAKSVKWKMKTDVAFINSGSVRAPIRKGKITLKDIAEVQPFDNHLVKFSAAGKIIKEALDHGIKRGGGAFPQTAGISFDISGDLAKNIRINDAPIDLKEQYTVGSTDFLLTGGDGYNMFTRLSDKKYSDVKPANALADYIRLKRVIEP